MLESTVNKINLTVKGKKSAPQPTRPPVPKTPPPPTPSPRKIPPPPVPRPAAPPPPVKR